MNHIGAFDEYRPLLFSIAYRMLGSVMDAEDIVQEAFLRWQQASADDIQSPKSYLSAIVTRLCIDHLRSAYVRREAYTGPWLPEPLVAGSGFAETMAQKESVSIAFLVLLEKLSPLERAVFLLREVFDYGYDEIAQIVDKSEANCRQIVRRAHQHIGQPPRYDVSPEQRDRLAAQFMHTLASGDMNGFLALLADDITLVADGGGKVSSALNPIYGPDRVTRFLFGLLKRLPPDLAVRVTEVNGQPGFAIFYGSGEPYAVMALEIAGDRIRQIHNILNPDKLRRLPPFKESA